MRGILLGAFACLVGVFFCASSQAHSTQTISPILGELLNFHPSWISRSSTSHDPVGKNWDGSGNGHSKLHIDDADYHVLFHGKGEGRITRLWMTIDKKNIETDWQELWIQVDGQTVYRGSVADYFYGAGFYKAPLVLGPEDSSGGYLSYVPYSYSRDAKVLLKGRHPWYFQVTYREGAGSSAGPSAAQIAEFLADKWWERAAPAAVQASVSKTNALTLASGPVTLAALRLQTTIEDLAHLKIKAGANAPVPATFFFGYARSAEQKDEGGENQLVLSSSLNHVDLEQGDLLTRLPIPLQVGEALTLVSDSDAPIAVRFDVTRATAHVPAVHLQTQFRDQQSPGTETTMPFFVSEQPLHFVSLIEEVTKPYGTDGGQLYLEGDEMIRTDAMAYPLQLGTGTEDYYNGGWYFLGTHTNPMTGEPRLAVNDANVDWAHSSFEQALYRHHILDLVTSRSGMRFGFEAGELGAFQPARYRSLGVAYTFDATSALSKVTVKLDGTQVESANDAEVSEKPRSFVVHYTHERTKFTAVCPAKAADGILITRTYDAGTEDQEALLRINGRVVGKMFEFYANEKRRFAQNSRWVDLLPTDCASGKLELEIDPTVSKVTWSESEYEIRFFSTGTRTPEVTTGERVRVFNTQGEPEPHYVNDHTFIQDDKGSWHLYGIYHAEPADAEREREFVHAVTSDVSPQAWNEKSFRYAEKPIALEYREDLGESHLWAPHVVRDGDRYVMVYQSGGENDRSQIRLAESRDLANWKRVGDKPLFEDLCVARDPMLKKIGELWVLYYTRCNGLEEKRSGVAYRTSMDLKTWSAPHMALTLGQQTALDNSGYTESPHVFERNGWFYLSVTSYPVDYEASFLYRSRSPFHFNATPVARLESHAPEWITDPATNQLYMSHAGWDKGGVWIAPVTGI